MTHHTIHTPAGQHPTVPAMQSNSLTVYSRYAADKHITYLRTLGCSRITEVQHSDGSIVIMWKL